MAIRLISPLVPTQSLITPKINNGSVADRWDPARPRAYVLATRAVARRQGAVGGASRCRRIGRRLCISPARVTIVAPVRACVRACFSGVAQRVSIDRARPETPLIIPFSFSRVALHGEFW